MNVKVDLKRVVESAVQRYATHYDKWLKECWEETQETYATLLRNKDGKWYVFLTIEREDEQKRDKMLEEAQRIIRGGLDLLCVEYQPDRIKVEPFETPSIVKKLLGQQPGHCYQFRSEPFELDVK